MLRLMESISKRCPGGKLPGNYLVFDTETTGSSRYDDRILQVGTAIVYQGSVVASYGQILNRGSQQRIQPGAERVHGISHARMTNEGVDPAFFVPQLLDQFLQWRRQGGMFCGHNIMAFDAPFLELEAKLLGREFKFGDDEVIDTGMLVKAAQLGMFMRDDECLRSFYLRVSGVFAKGIFWSLDNHCYDTYGLEKRSGITRAQAHDAEADCKLTSALLETLKETYEKERVA